MSAMHLFQNGHAYAIAVALSPPYGKRPPFVEIEMAGSSGRFVPVVGKMDTGADATMLDFSTAHSLGIACPESADAHTARTANGQGMTYHVHRILVRVKNDSEEPLNFSLNVAFSETVERNLFGLDWTKHLIVAVDSKQVHLLRD